MEHMDAVADMSHEIQRLRHVIDNKDATIEYMRELHAAEMAGLEAQIDAFRKFIANGVALQAPRQIVIQSVAPDVEMHCNNCGKRVFPDRGPDLLGHVRTQCHGCGKSGCTDCVVPDGWYNLCADCRQKHSEAEAAESTSEEGRPE